jgi:heme-degrading monooxygenase HmoA
MSVDFTQTPHPPYYAAIFTAVRKPGDGGYAAMAERMIELARQQPGCFGVDAAYGPGGIEIIVAYFTSDDEIRKWKDQPVHVHAQNLGKSRWYEHYEVRIAKVERAYQGPNGGPSL